MAFLPFFWGGCVGGWGLCVLHSVRFLETTADRDPRHQTRKILAIFTADLNFLCGGVLIFCLPSVFTLGENHGEDFWSTSSEIFKTSYPLFFTWSLQAHCGVL